MPSLENSSHSDSDLFISAVITDLADDRKYLFAKFSQSGSENGLPYEKGNGAFIWMNGYSKENMRVGMNIFVTDLRKSNSWKKEGDKQFCANLAPMEFQSELSFEQVEPARESEPVSITPTTTRVVDSTIEDRKAEMLDLKARLTVTRTFKGVKANYLNFLSASVGNPSEALEACIEYCYNRNFGF